MALHFNEIDELASVRRLTLSVDSGVLHEGICAKQGDSKSRYLEITLQSEEDRIITPGEGTTPRLRCVKPDETLVISDGRIEGGRVLVELTAPMLTAPGTAYADIALYEGEQIVLSTQLFQINITKTPFDDETVESTDDFSALSNALLDAKAVLGKADAAVVRAEEAVKNSKEAIAEAQKKAQADFAQNDPESPEYVRNRTHWIEKGIGDVWAEMNYSVAGSAEPMMLTEDVTELTAGSEYTVRWNGAEYICTAQEITVDNHLMITALDKLKGMSLTALGNQYAFSSEATATSEPFAIAVIPESLRADAGGISAVIVALDGSLTGTLSIAGEVDIYHPLDHRFIPGDIAAKGVTPNLAQNDPTQPDYVDGRTHWVEQVRSVSEILPETAATYDDGEGIFYIAAEIPLTAGETYTVNWNGVDYDTMCVEVVIDPTEGITTNALGDVYVVDSSLAEESTGEPFVIIPYPAELTGGQAMAMAFPIDSCTELTLSIKGETVTEVVHQLPEKFVPASWIPKRTVVERVLIEPTSWDDKRVILARELLDIKSITATLTVNGETITDVLTPVYAENGISIMYLTGRYITMMNYSGDYDDTHITLSKTPALSDTPTDISMVGEYYEYNKMPYQHMTSVTVETLSESSLRGIQTLLNNNITVRYMDGIILAAYSDSDISKWSAVWANKDGIHVEGYMANSPAGLYLGAYRIVESGTLETMSYKLTVDKNGTPTITGVDDPSKVWTPEDVIQELKPQPANLWDADTATDGSYVNANTGVVTSNANMTYGDYIPIFGGAVFSYPATYIQGAFYDADKTYISGFSCNHEYNQTYPTVPYYTVTAPADARYVRISTRLGNRYSFIFSPADMLMQVDGERELVASAVPKSRVIEEYCDVVYDVEFNAANPSELSINTAYTYADGYMTCTTAYAVMRYAKYVTLDRSRISAIFKTDTDTKFQFGYALGSAYGASGVADNALGIVVDTAARTMTARKWDGVNSSSVVQIGEPVSFDFEIANGMDHYIEVEKRTVNEVRVRLYCADCPGKAAEMTLTASQNSSNESLYTDYMRCWGGGALQLVSGSISVKRMTMVSTGNQYARTMVIGDSFVEHAGRNPLCGYAQRMYEATGGNVFIDGRGGATAADTLKRIVVSLNCCHPQYVVLNVGANDSTSVSTDTFKENLGKLISVVESKGAIPVLVTVPRRTDSDNLTFMQTINPWIKSSGYRYIDLAAALSTGDSETQDVDKYIADGVHPSIAGGEAIYLHIEAKLPQLMKPLH